MSTKAPRERRGTAIVGTASLVGVGLVAAGIVGATAFAAEPVPDTAQPWTGAETIAVQSEQYDGAHSLAATPQLGDQQVLRVAATGRVTLSRCAPGAAATSGTSVFSVDGRPLVSLATSEPLYRDLAPRDAGPDVSMLQAELARLGDDVPRTGTYDATTGNAVAALQSAVGTSSPPTTLLTASVLWLPAGRVTIASCSVHVGDWVTSGTQVATLAGALRSITLATPPGDGWLAHYGDHTAPIDASGVITDPAFLAAVEAGPELAALQAAPDGGSELQLQVALATARTVVVVPPSAIVATSDATGCIVVDRAAVPVTIVASSLGQTLVATTDGSTPSEVAVHPDPASACS